MSKGKQMNKIVSVMCCLLITISLQAVAADYKPKSGDIELDASLVNLNKKYKNKTLKFTRGIASEFQVPIEKVEELFKHYQFSAADVLMTMSIADATGQPVNNISRAYFEHKKEGWKFALEQLEIKKGSKAYLQIVKDAKIEF